jgi:hypothetical protein
MQLLWQCCLLLHRLPRLTLLLAAGPMSTAHLLLLLLSLP